MPPQGVALSPATSADIPYIERVLEEHDLPTADLEGNPEWFYIASLEGGQSRVGTGGIQPYDEVGLLRSVAVEESMRGRGIGTALCDELEAVARTQGIETLYLLTTTAASFFADRGYTTVARSEPPAPIQQTAQFEDLCPATATCMRKSLPR